MSGAISDITDANFESDVLQADTPVLVDFWAPWCGPCRQLSPIIEELAKEYDGRVKVCKVNIDEQPGSAAKYGVRSIPTVMLFKNGNAEATKIGMANKTEFSNMIDSAL